MLVQPGGRYKSVSNRFRQPQSLIYEGRLGKFVAAWQRDDSTAEGEDYSRVPLPDQRNKEIFAIADALLGASRIKVVCADGKSRMGRIPGKMKKRQWIRPGDLVVVKPWDFQDDKCDVLLRYTRTQAVNLAKRKLLPESINVFS